MAQVEIKGHVAVLRGAAQRSELSVTGAVATLFATPDITSPSFAVVDSQTGQAVAFQLLQYARFDGFNYRDMLVARLPRQSDEFARPSDGRTRSLVCSLVTSRLQWNTGAPSQVTTSNPSKTACVVKRVSVGATLRSYAALRLSFALRRDL